MQAKRTATRKSEIPAVLVRNVCRRLTQNKRVRRTLLDRGRLHIDRQLPFLCVYRRPVGREDGGTMRLVKSEASYLVVSGAPRLRQSVTHLVREVVATLAAEFGAFLIVEIWAAPDGGKANDPSVPSVPPTFTIHAPPATSATRAVEVLEQRLKRIKVLKQAVVVEVRGDTPAHPPEMRPLLPLAVARELNCAWMGLAVPPVYRALDTGKAFPVLLRSLRRSLSLALRQTYFEFARAQTTHHPPHYHALGRRAVVKAVWEIDRQLAAVSNQFDYLLQLTPVNSDDAWKQFRRDHFERIPEFHYRPLPVDPGLLKRELYRIPIERVEDPALQRLFQEKQEELELKLSMLRDRDTPRFLYQSLQLFGGVEDELFELASNLLTTLPIREVTRGVQKSKVNAQQFARQAEADFAHYRQISPEFKASVEVTSEVNGLLVSRGRLLINSAMDLPVARVEALLAHEVGTHLLTYYNGRLQPFQQLYSGLAGYEELQEGLAVLAEYLVGGLSRGRMRQLAARVVAARQLTDGASFVETFRTLDRTYQFAQQTAYGTTMRVYRGGGLTKDIVYLRGLCGVLRYVQKGGDLEPLLIGKMAAEHIPIIRELQYRNVLQPPVIIPRYLQQPAAQQRLNQLRQRRVSVIDLVGKTVS